MYFHISKTRATRMILSEADIDLSDYEEGKEPDVGKVRDGLSSRIRGVMSRGKGSEILELFDWLVSNAYGEIGDDGETFEQSDELYKKWMNTASYDKFFSDLVTDTDQMTEFVNKIFPEELQMAEKNLDPEFATHRKRLEENQSR